MGAFLGRPRPIRADGKVVLITGCSEGGIGYALAVEYARRGATVYATARRLEAMRGLQEQGVTIMKLDVTNEEDIQHAVETIMRDAGRVDVLVNNAAVFATRPLADTPLPDWRALFETNLLGVVAMAQAVFPHMAERKQGLVINVSSCAGFCHLPMAAAYSASKAALNAATNCMRMEMKPFGVRVMLAVPGFIKTKIHSNEQHNRKPLPSNSLYKSCESRLNHLSEWAVTKFVETSPEEFAEATVDASLKRDPPWRFFMGAGWRQAMYGVWLLPMSFIDMELWKPYQAFSHFLQNLSYPCKTIMYAQGSPGYHTPYTSPYASPYTSPAMGGQLPRRPIPMPSGSAPATPSSGDARLAASHGFQYNARVATALLPCVLVLLGAGGPLVVGTLVAGLMISYILDALQFKNGAFVAIWCTFFTTAAALAFSGLGFAPHIPVIISVLILLTAMHLVFLCGVWVSLQFRWLQLEHPFVVLALERLLFACTPMTAIAIITYGLIAAIGAAHAPFYLMPCVFALYWLFSLPRASSFKSPKHTLQQQQQARHGGKESSQDVWIIGPMEGLFHMMLVLFLPCGFHLAVHHNRIFESANEACDTLLLFFVPVLFVLYASKKGALNWLTTDKAKLKRVQILNGGFSLAVVLICFEIRVIFTSYAHYIHFPPPLNYLLVARPFSPPPQQVQILNGGFSLAVVLICFEIRVIFTSYGHYIHFPPPLNYMLVALALFGLGFGFAAHMMGVLRGAVGSAVVTTVLLVSAVAGSLVIGMPVTVLPAPAIAAAYLAHYYTTGSITSYFIFAAASLLAAAWFVMDQYFALAIVFAGVTLKALCQQLLLLLLLALLVPGAALFQKSQRVVGIIVVAQAFLFAGLEFLLYNGEAHAEGGVYPAFLVLATTVAGFVAMRKLRIAGKIGAVAEWVGICLYLSKLPMLVVHSQGVLLGSQLLLLAISPPFFLYQDKSRPGSRMKPWMAVMHSALVLLTVLFCRYVIFDVIVSASGHKPSHALLIGSLGLIAVAGCLPIGVLHFPNSLKARRAGALAAAACLLFLILQPPLPPAWHVVWDEDHFPDDDPDDSTIYGQSVEGPVWPVWLLLGTIVSALAAFFSAIPIAKVESVRLIYSFAIGLSSGIYLAAKFIPLAPILCRLLLLAASVLAALFLVLTHHPTAWSGRLMPPLFAAQILLFPLQWLALGRATLVDNGEGEEVPDFYEETRLETYANSLCAIFCTFFLLAALVIKFKLSAALRDKLTGAGAGSGRAAVGGVGGEGSSTNGESALPKSSPFGPKHRAIQTRPLNLLASFFSRKSWMPLVGNISTMLAFILALLLSSEFATTDTANHAIFLLVPILLLLNQDSQSLGSFTDRHRYFPLTAVLSGYLLFTDFLLLFSEAYSGIYYWGTEWFSEDDAFFQCAKSLLLLLLCAPMHYVFNRFMWDNKRRADYLLLVLGPLCLPAAVLPTGGDELPSIRTAGCLGVMYAVVQYLVSRHIRIAGMKFI
ncbi:unnamed protein product [Closterium sp. Yama58-4]|nr:unnamed protein product [Closterium sp. Yama58-4]